MDCGCHCIKCGSIKLNSKQVGIIEKDGYFDMHHTCIDCNTHFDHLEGITFEACDVCNYKTN
ncbi:MAG: hypothetical protein IH814_01485 [Thaumarchaeota archaeon]|nr:hypothetical protein [Nitrososphaerota archaeon]